MPNDPTILQPGELRHLITIEAPATVGDASGQPLETWVPILNTRASVQAVSVREQAQDNALVSQVTHIVKLRYPGALIVIAPGQRVATATLTYHIQAVENVLNRNRVLRIQCVAIDATSTGVNRAANGTPVVSQFHELTAADIPDLAESQITGLVADLAKKADRTSLALVATTGSFNDLSDKPAGTGGAQVNADWNASSGTAQILNKPALAAVATSGAYSDLQGKPTIPAAQVQTDWNASSGLGVLLNKPTIPAAQVPSDWNAASGAAQILNKPTIPSIAGLAVDATVVHTAGSETISYTRVTGLGTSATQNASAFDASGAAASAQAASLQKTSNLSDLASASTARTNLGLATVASTGSYSDLTAKPTIPTAATSSVSGTVTLASGQVSSTLSKVATTGAYADLSGTPTIPVASSTNPVMNGTVAIGSLTTYAKADHVHPSDTSKAGTATFTSVAAGLVPASGGGTTNFLRADGTWSAQAGGSGITAVSHDATLTGDGNGTPLSVVSAGTGAVQAKTTSYTMLITDALVVMTSASAQTVTLTTSGLTAGKKYVVKSMGLGITTVAPATGTIDGQPNVQLSQYQSLELMFDAVNFSII